MHHREEKSTRSSCSHSCTTNEGQSWKWLLSVAELALLSCLLFAGITSTSPHPATSRLLQFILLVLCCCLYLAERCKTVSRYDQLLFRPVSGQGSVTAIVTIMFIFNNNMKIVLPGFTSHTVKNLPSLANIYYKCIIVMSAATVFIGVVFVFHVDMMIISLTMVFSCYFLQDHLVDLGTAVPFAAIVIYLALFWTLNRLCPRSFTIGESSILCQAVTILLIDFASIIAMKTRFAYFLENIDLAIIKDRSQASVLVSTLLVSAIIISVCLSPVFYCLSQYAKTSNDHLIYSLAFYAGGVLNIIAVFLPIAYLSLGVNIYLFLMQLVSLSTIILIIYWIILLALAIVIVVWRTDNNKKNQQMFAPNIIIRKLFHFIAVLIFVPGIFFHPEFMKVASAVAVIVMSVTEYVRIFQIYPFGNIVHKYLIAFVDEKDAGIVILTHIYLLLGFSVPVWLFPFNSQHNLCILAPYAGVISLGVGDAFASIFGTIYGKLRLPGAKKTFIGTLACFLSQIVASVVILALYSPNFSLSKLLTMFLGILFVSLMEAITSQVDNLILPPILYGVIIFICWCRLIFWKYQFIEIIWFIYNNNYYGMIFLFKLSAKLISLTSEPLLILIS